MPFPSSPDSGEQYTIDNVTWEYVSSKGAWELVDWQNLSAPSISVFTSSGTWTKPTNADIVYVVAVGGGQAGTDGSGTSNVGTGGGGGNGGSVSSIFYDASLLSSTQSVTVGTGGIYAGTVNGGFSSFAGLKALGAEDFGYGMFSGSFGGSGGSGGDSEYGSISGANGGTRSDGIGLYVNGGAGGGDGGAGVGVFETGSGGNGGQVPYGASPTLVNLPAIGSVGAGYGAGGNGGIGYSGDSGGTSTNGTNGIQGIVIVVTWLSA